MATFEQLKNLHSIGEYRAHAILDVRAHLDRDLTLLDLTLEVGIPSDVIRSIINGKLLCLFRVTTESLWRRSMLKMKRTLMGLAADFARQMEVPLAALDRITMEMERLSESVQKVNVRHLF